MFVPSLEVAKITVSLLDAYKYDDQIEDALKLDYKFVTPEEFLKEFFSKSPYSEEAQDEATEFFFIIYKYRKYLMQIENELQSEKVLSTEKNTDESSYSLVFLYLLIIELNEITKSQIISLLLSLNEKKTLSLLKLLKKSDSITKLYRLGARIWDTEYVKEILENVLKNPLFEEVYETVSNQEKSLKKVKKKDTIFRTVPSGLSYPKSYTQPLEIKECCNAIGAKSSSSVTRIPVWIKPTHIPSSTYTVPIQLEKIKEASKKHREDAKKKLEEAQKKAFRVANIQKSDKYKKLLEEMHIKSFCPAVRKSSWNKIKEKDVKPPKKTAAVILREGARLLKLEQEEIKRFEDLANGGFNSDILSEWEKEIREETYRKHIEDIEKKHIEGLLTYEEALIAKQKCLKKKKEKADEFRKEKENWINQLELWRKEEQQRIRESFEKGKAYEKGGKEAVQHVKEEKHKIVLEQQEESRSLRERWLKEKEEDLQRKIQLIKEIKAIQALGVIKRKQTDFTETANSGLLYEMSLAELKERLFILKIEVQEELERRRAEIKMRRECRKEIIESYQELIESHRKILYEQKKLEWTSENKEIKKETRLTRSSTSLDGLRQKLYEKRKERITHQVMC